MMQQHPSHRKIITKKHATKKTQILQYIRNIKISNPIPRSLSFKHQIRATKVTNHNEISKPAERASPYRMDENSC